MARSGSGWKSFEQQIGEGTKQCHSPLSCEAGWGGRQPPMPFHTVGAVRERGTYAVLSAGPVEVGLHLNEVIDAHDCTTSDTLAVCWLLALVQSLEVKICDL